MACVSHGWHGILQGGVRTRDYEKPLPRRAVPRGDSPSAELLARPRRRLAPPARRNRPGGRPCRHALVRARVMAGTGTIQKQSPLSCSRARARPTGRRQGRAPKSSTNSLAAVGCCHGPYARGCTSRVVPQLAFTLPSLGFHRPGRGRRAAQGTRKAGAGRGSRVGDGRWLRGARTRATASRHWR
jgi:hypothetical protein